MAIIQAMAAVLVYLIALSMRMQPRCTGHWVVMNAMQQCSIDWGDGSGRLILELNFGVRSVLLRLEGMVFGS